MLIALQPLQHAVLGLPLPARGVVGCLFVAPAGLFPCPLSPPLLPRLRARSDPTPPVALAALSPPNILAIFDVGEEGGVAFAVTELLEGETLRERLAQGALPPRTCLSYALQIADGLAAAHERGIVHRDLKPENLFLTAD